MFFLPLEGPSTLLGVLSLSKEGGFEVGVKYVSAPARFLNKFFEPLR
jgi:hypothetical protein